MKHKIEWRPLADEEYAQLVEAAALRRGLPSDERTEFVRPDAADRTVSGALLWAWHTVRQDHPNLILIGAIAIAWQIIRITLGAFGITIW